ncbi:unnamed protein product [Caenorhabditis sp. 36 PRJEB53466]|nr:unnamed protein product [Caenorhabditis sp. 36 PRJEB53466]
MLSSPNSGGSSNDSTTTTIEKEAYYHGLLPREDVRLLLDKNGDYLVRSSEATKGEVSRSYIVSVMFDNKLDEEHSVKHYVVNHADRKYWVSQEASFDSIQFLIAHYSKTPSADVIKMVSPVKRVFWELEHESITILKKLGEGAFGEVSAGSLKFKKGGKQVSVAVKQAKLEKMGKEQIKDFMAEARNMRKFGHQNVVRFYGVAVLQEPLYLVMELATGGALDHYLKKNEDLSVEKRNEMLLQAAWGLEYLHGKPVLHRDIAARNCLYGDGKVKISDFGLTRTGTFYQMRAGGKVPIRWLALETIKTFIYTQKTDVWSYGIMAWEIYNNGGEPYPGLTLPEVTTQIQSGYRMTLPPHATPDVQTLVTKCWAENANDRPTMPDIATALQRITGIHRPNFAAIARKEAEELLLMNTATHKGTQRRRAKKAAVPKGM